MKIVFLDRVAWDYNVDTPWTQPLGGTQSAICYLTAELARLGHDVWLVNRVSAKGNYRGVHCVPWDEGRSSNLLHLADVIIVVNFGAAAKLRREGIRAPLILWAHHRYNQWDMRGLRSAHERGVWSGYALVSRWMAEEYLQLLDLPAERTRVLHSGVGEPYAAQKPMEPWFIENRAPMLIYTSMPDRGLDVLLDAFPSIRLRVPDVQLRVYSGGSLYRIEREPDDFRLLYERCRRMQGVEYIGPVGQSQLAHELANAAALAYPATIPETFCLVAAEAMSLGAMLLTTRVGALPELFGKFAFMVGIPGGDHRQELVDIYGALVIDALAAARRDPVGNAERRRGQIAFIKDHYTWPPVAKEWVVWLEEIVDGSG
jgi:glycosyltransferase involved in cell wall biosynthesis